MRYIAAELERLGLQPLGDGPPGARSYVQRFPIVALHNRVVAPPVVRARGGELRLQPGKDAVVVSGSQRAVAKLVGAPLVFVGFGITAPEERWDDYAGVDVRGKVVVILNNDPAMDPKRFGGVTRLYYGRWDYKYDSAARQGAAGAIIIHTTPSAGYGFNVIQSSWTGEQFSLPYEGGPKLQVKGWVTEEGARRIAKLGGQDLDALRAAAQKRDFKPVPLGVRWSLVVTAEVQKKPSTSSLERPASWSAP